MKQLLIIVPLVFIFSCSGEKKEEQGEQPKELPSISVDPLAEKEVVSFVYHRFGDNRFPSTNIAVEDFEAHLSWFKAHQYQMLTLSDAIDYLKSDEPVKRTAVITVDDGYKSFYKNGLPLLVKYNMPATLFINTQTVGGGDYMDWKDLKEAAEKKDIEIGNHTHSHAYFLNEPQNTRYTSFLDDIELSQKLIAENLQLKPRTFAYPYGEFDPEMKAIVKDFGFIAAAAQNSGVINSTTDTYQLPRFPMSEAYAKMFEEKAKTESLKVIQKSPVQSVVSRDELKPILTLTLDVRGLLIDQMQCFVQGSSCKMSMVEKTATQIVLTLQTNNSIANRRRTLYTLTAPDSSGNWHWYSHLWINPSVK